MGTYLKTMHDGGNELDTASAPHSIYSDVTECHFVRSADGSAWANLTLREPVKTATVPGFVEIEKHIHLTGDAFLMNEQGRTISTFKLDPFGRQDSKVPPTRGCADVVGSDEPEPSDEALTRLPYETAVAIRVAARGFDQFAGTESALTKTLDRLKIAVDA